MSRPREKTTLLPGAYKSLGYRSATVARGSGRALPTAGSADRHLDRDRQLLVRMGSEFARDNAIYQGIIERALDGIFGSSGFTLQAQTKSKRLNQQLEAGWEEFAQACEARGMFDFRECSRIVGRSVFDHGDIGQLFTEDRLFQYFESEQINGGKLDAAAVAAKHTLQEGVELTALGRPVRYWASGYDRNGYVRTGAEEPTDAEHFNLIAHRTRVSQTRGVPVLTSAFSMVHRINDVCDAEAIAWQLLSRFAIAINRENGAEAAFAESEADNDGRDSPPDLADRVTELDEAIIFHGETGETVSAISRDLPGANFPESVRMYLRLIGMPLGLPLEVILLDYSKTNYTGARAALEQAFRSFVKWQKFFKRRHHTPSYRRWVRWQIEDGLVPERADIYAHQWDAPEFPWVDQLKEAQAWGERMDRGLATQTAALQSVGIDRAQYLSTRSREIQDAMEKAREINAANADQPPVDWRMLVGVPVGTTEMAVRAGDEEGPPNAGI